MDQPHLTRRQQEVYEFLRDHSDQFAHPPSLDELCQALGLSSRGSLHKHIQALIEAGLIEPMEGRQRGIRLTEQHATAENQLPLLGRIAAGSPIEAVTQQEFIEVPSHLHTGNPCYVLQVKGDSMIEEGIFDGDWVIIEQRDYARNGEIVVALVKGEEATLKRFERDGNRVTLYPANASHAPQHYPSNQVIVQGVLVGQMRKY